MKVRLSRSGGVVAAFLVLLLATSPIVRAAEYRFSLLLGGQAGQNTLGAAGINASGWAAGTVLGNEPQAGVWTPAGAFSVFSSPGSAGNATAINDRAEVVGYGSRGAYIWTRDRETELRPLSGGGWAAAYGINNRSQVVGLTESRTDMSGSRATLWNGSEPIELGGNNAGAWDINDSGQIVGAVGSRPVIWNGTEPTELGTLGGPTGQALAINEAGDIAGYSTLPLSSATHATLWRRDGSIVDLGTPSAGSIAYALNDLGDVVGSGAGGAMLWTDGKAIDLNSFLDIATRASWVLTDATGINDSGWIVGNASGTDPGISQHVSFLLAPVPEQPVAYLLALGLAVVALGKARASARSDRAFHLGGPGKASTPRRLRDRSRVPASSTPARRLAAPSPDQRRAMRGSALV